MSEQVPNKAITERVQQRPWNPYLMGALTGLALALSFLFADRGFGVSAFYGYFAKAISQLISGESLLAVDSLERAELRPVWHLLFGLGIPLGAFLGAYLSGEWRLSAVPALWQKHFGESATKRALWAFLGGALGMIGTRLAMGCPSGLGMSGMVVMSVGGFIGMAAFFIGGIALAQVLYANGKREDRNGPA